MKVKCMLQIGVTYFSKKYQVVFRVIDIVEIKWGMTVAIVDFLYSSADFDFIEKSPITKYDNPLWEGLYMIPIELAEIIGVEEEVS